jgi:hypothetical protein
MLTDFSAWEKTLDDTQRQQLETTFKYEPDREAAQKRFAAVASVAAYTNSDVQEVSNRFEDYYMHAFARDEQVGLGLTGGVKDINEFQKLLIERADANKVKFDTFKSASASAVNSALRGSSSLNDFAAWQLENEHMPEAFSDKAYEVWQKTYSDIENELGKDGRAAASRAFRAMRTMTGVAQESDASVNEAKRDLINLRVRSPKAYDLALASVQLMAQDTGSAEKGIAQGVGETFGRITSDLAASTFFAKPLLEISQDASEAMVKAGITNAENPEQLAAQIRARREVENDVRDISRGVIDPVKKTREGLAGYAEDAAYFIGSSVPYMIAAAIPGGQSSIIGSFTSDNYNTFRSSGWEGASAVAAAVSTGAFEAAVENASRVVLKIPGVAGLFQKFGVKPGSSWATQFFLRSAAQGGTEVVEEIIQEATAPFVQELTNAIIPSIPDTPEGKHLSDIMGKFFEVENFAPLVLSILPLGMIGAGISTSQDMDYLKDVQSFFDDDIASEIMAETDPAKRDAIIREKFKAMTAEEFINRARGVTQENVKQFEEASKAFQQAEDSGIIPRVRRDANGWAIENNETGAVVRVSTREEAIKMVFGHLDEQEQRRAQAAAQLWDEIYEKGGMGAEVLRAEVGDMNTKRLAARSPEEAERVKRGVEIYAQLHGLTSEEAQKVVFGVMGFNRDETIEGIRSAVSSVFGRGMNVGTVLHEAYHGRWRAGLKSGIFTHDQGVKWVRLAEQATGIDFLPSKVDADITAEVLDEAIIDVSVSDNIGRRKDGRGFSANLISRGMAALARGERNTQLGTTADQRADAREAGIFATWLKSWKEFWGVVMQKGKALRKAKAEGKLGEDYDAFLDKLMSISPQARYEAEAAREAQEIAAGSDMSFSISAQMGRAGEIVNDDFFSDPDTFYRVVHGDAAFNDIVQSGLVRTNGNNKGGVTIMERLKERPTAFPSFRKGSAAMSYAAENPIHYIITTTDSSMQPSTSGRHSKGSTMFPTDANGNHLRSLDGSKVDVWKHLGDGQYQRVYSKGSLVQTPIELANSSYSLRPTNVIAKEKGIPSTITPKVAAEFKGRPIVSGMADLLAASGTVRGVDVHGGPGYPVEKFDPEDPEKITGVWASMRTGIQTILSNMEKGNAIWKDENGHHWALFSPHTMLQSSHKSNAQTPRVYLSKVNKMASKGAISQEHITEISNHIRSTVSGAVSMPNLGTVEAETFFGKASFEMRANIMAELTTARSRDLGAPSPDSILTESRDSQYHGAMPAAITSLILIDVDRLATQNEDGKWVLRKDIGAKDVGVEPHPSYDTVIPGRILAHFEHPIPFDLATPVMVETMKAASPTSRPAFLLTRMPANAGIQFQPLTDDIVKNINEVQAIGSMFPEQKNATLPQIKMMVDAVNGKWTTFTQGASTKGLTEFTNAIDRSPAKESLTPYTADEVSDMVKDGTMTVHQLGDYDVWFGIKKGEGNAKDLVSVVNNTGIPGTLNVIMAKALELGANKLDAYAVAVPGMPNGLLPTLYKRHGWKQDSRSEFDRQYLLEQIKEEDLEVFKDRIAEKYKDEKGKAEDQEAFKDRVAKKYKKEKLEGEAPEVFKDRLAQKYKGEKIKAEGSKDFRDRMAKKYLGERFEAETSEAFEERLAQKEAALRMYWEEQGWDGQAMPDMVFMSHDGIRTDRIGDENRASLVEAKVESIGSAPSETDGTVRGRGFEGVGAEPNGGGTVESSDPNRGVLPRGADTIVGSLEKVTDTQLQAIGITRAEFDSFKENASAITSYSLKVIEPGSAAERSANVSYSLTKAEQLKEKIGKMSAAQMRKALDAATLTPDDAMINLLGKFPEYLNPVIDSIVAKRKQLIEGKLTMRDLGKAYFMTVASIGASAIDVQTIKEKAAERGMPFDPDDLFLSRGAKGQAQIRPEEMAAWWLGTPQGQTALNNLEAGKFDPADWEDGLLFRDTFGRNDLRSKVSKKGIVTPGAMGTPKKDQFNFTNLKEALDAINASKGNPDLLEAAVLRINGIAEGKKGFISHMLGFGEWATIDAVEINLWLTGKGDTTKASDKHKEIVGIAKRASGTDAVNRALFDRIRAGIKGLRNKAEGADQIPEEVAAHVIHHWIWDRAKGIETTHEGMYHAMTSYSLTKVQKYVKHPRQEGEAKSYEEVTERYKGTQNLIRSSEGRVHSSIVRDLLKRRYEGENISPEVLDRAIKEYFPSYRVKVPKTIADLSSEEEIFNAIDKGQREKHAESMERGLPAEGDITTVRQDVPSAKQGVGTVTTRSGENVYYRPATRLKNALFDTNEKATLMIGMNLHNKGPHIKIEGQWMEDQSMPTDLENWTQVGFNPDRHSYYYERGTERQVVSADEIYQVGNTVFSKNAVFKDERTDISYSLAPRSLTEVADTVLAAQMRKPEFRESFYQLARAKMAKLRQQVNMKDRPVSVDQSAEIQAEIEAARVDYQADVDQLRKDRDFELAGSQQDKSGKLTQEQIRRDFDGKISQRQKEWIRQKAELDAKLSANDTAIDKGAANTNKDKQMMALRTLDAVLSAFPPEIRGMVGGFVKLASLNSDEDREAEIIRRLDKLDEVVEKSAKKHYGEQIEKIFNKAAPKRDGGKKPTGKLGPQVQALFDLAETFTKMNEASVAAERTAITEAMANNERNPAKLADLLEREQLLDLFGAIYERTSAEMESATQWLADSYKQGRNIWSAVVDARLEEMKEARGEAKDDIGKEGLDSEQQEAIEQAKTIKGKTKAYVLSFLSFEQVMHSALGRSSKLAKSFVSLARRATNQKTDALINKRKAFRSQMAAIFGTTQQAQWQQRLFELSQISDKSAMTITKMEGANTETVEVPAEIIERILNGQAQAKAFKLDRLTLDTLANAWADNEALPAKNRKKNLSYEVTTGGIATPTKLSQLQAIHLSMMAKQAGYTENLAGHGWDADAMADIEKKLTPEAKAIRNFLAEEYRTGYDRLNAVFSRMYGLNLPRITNYAPGTFEAMNAMGQDIDPYGQGLLSEGGFKAGMLKTRQKHNAKPRLEDALSVYWGHINSTEHFIAFGEFTRDIRGVLNHAEVRGSITAKGGKALLESVQNWITAFERNGVESRGTSSAFNEFIRRRQSSQAYLSLAFNVGTLMKQSTAALGSLLNMGPMDAARQLAKLLSGQLDLVAAYRSAAVQRRLDSGFSPEVRQGMAGMMAEAPNWGTPIVEKGMETIGIVDAMFTTASYAMAYDYHLRQAKIAKLSDTQAAIFATREAEETVARTAQPSEMMDRSLVELGMQPLGKFLFMFASEARQKAAMAWEAYAPSSGLSKGERASRLILLHIVFPLIIQTITSAWRDARDDGEDDELFDEKNWQAGDYAKSMILGPLLGIPVIGSGLNAAMTGIFGGHFFANDPNQPLNQAAGGAVDIMEAITEGDLDSGLKGAKALIRASAMVLGGEKAAAVGVGVNILSDAYRIIENITE